MFKIYRHLSKEELAEKVESLEGLVDQLKEEKDEDELLNFPWVGNLGHWYWDLETNRVVCNDQKILALDYVEEEIPKEIGYEFFTSKLHPEDYERVMDNMRDHLEGRSDAYEVNYRIQGNFGDWKWYYDRGKVTKFNKEGEPLILAGIVFDITKSKNMELEIKKQNEKLIEMIDFDYLTKVYNRKAIFEKLELEMHKSNIAGQKLSLALLDIDNFSKVNYTYSYDSGDQVLEEVTEVIKSNIASQDMVGRYDGNKFLILLPNRSERKAKSTSEKIKEAIAGKIFTGNIKITVSCGVKEYQDEILRELLEELGESLYKDKNQTC